MAISRVEVADVGGNLITLFADLERRLAQEVALRIIRANNDPSQVDWAQRHLREVSALRAASQNLVQRATAAAPDRASAAVIEAMGVGRRAALNETRLLDGRKGYGTTHRLAVAALQAGQDLPGAGGIMRIAHSLAGRVGDLGLPVVRWATDSFQRVIAAGAAPGVLAGLDTRRKASERAWNQLLNEGVKGFTDARGRQWALASYVEMATRTAVAQAAIEAHAGQLQTLGLDLVIVSDVAGECHLCRPWEGKVLATSGPPGVREVTVQRLDSDRMVTLTVRGTVQEARQAGLFHPQCRHNVSAYFPGLTRRPPATATADPEGERARNDLRKLERDKRRWLQRQAGALSPEARKAAGDKIKEIDGKIEELIKTRGGVERGLPRRRDRERIDLGNKRIVPGTRPTPPAPKPKPTKTIPPAPAKATPAPKPKPAKVTPPPAPKAAPAPAKAPSKATVPPPAIPRIKQPYTLQPGKYPGDPGRIVPNLPDVDAAGVFKASPAPIVDYGSAYVGSVDDVIKARLHVDQIMRQLSPVDGRPLIPGGIATDEIRAALEFLSDLTPRAMTDLVWVGARRTRVWGSEGGPTTNAFYVFWNPPGLGSYSDAPWRSMHLSPNWYEAALRNDRNLYKQYGHKSGWSSQSGYPGSGGTIAHEYGHHLNSLLYRRNGHAAGDAFTPLDTSARPLVELIAKELRLTPPPATLTEYSLGQWVGSQRNQGQIVNLVSQYGASNFAEMFAEIFAEYATLGVKSRPHIRTIGEAIVRLVETDSM